MNLLGDLIGVELLKVIRSRIPLWTTLGALVMPLGMALLIFAAKNPALSKNLGLVSEKANLMNYAVLDWPAYLVLMGQVVAAGGFFFFVLAASWVFGREFVDSTLKDLLAVPAPRILLLAAKFFATFLWCAATALVIFAVSLAMGALIHLPGGSGAALLAGGSRVLVVAALVIAVSLPFAFFASVGRGYLLPLGLAILALMMANLVGVAGWGDYFPWAIPGLYAQGQSSLPPISYWIVLLTCLAGMAATVLWWSKADQSR